jgi:hypothetical protein
MIQGRVLGDEAECESACLVMAEEFIDTILYVICVAMRRTEVD